MANEERRVSKTDDELWSRTYLTKQLQEIGVKCKQTNLQVAKMSFVTNAVSSVVQLVGFVSGVVAFFYGAPVILIVVVSFRLAVSLADAACSAIVWWQHSQSKPCLPMGGDIVGNLAYAIQRLFGASEAHAKEQAAHILLGAVAIQLLVLGWVTPWSMNLANDLSVWHQFSSYLSAPFGAVASTMNELTWTKYRAKAIRLSTEEEKLRIQLFGNIYETIHTKEFQQIPRGRRFFNAILGFDTVDLHVVDALKYPRRPSFCCVC